MTPLHSPTLSPRSGYDASRSSRSPFLLCFECYRMATAVLHNTLSLDSPSSVEIYLALIQPHLDTSTAKIGSASSRCSLRQIFSRVPFGESPGWRHSRISVSGSSFTSFSRPHPTSEETADILLSTSSVKASSVSPANSHLPILPQHFFSLLKYLLQLAYA